MKRPKGWRRLKLGELVESGDKFMCDGKLRPVGHIGWQICEINLPHFRKLSPVKRRAKRDLQGSLQRRVGRSASDGLPGVVTRVVGRKKAVQSGVVREARFYRYILNQIASHKRKTLDQRLAASALRFWDALEGEILKSQLVSQTDAASRRRQRAIPANKKGQR